MKLKRLDKKIVGIFMVLVAIVASCVTVFASSDYYSYFNIGGGNSLNGATRSYTGSTISISYDANISGTGNTTVIECFETDWLGSTSLGWKDVNPYGGTYSWNMIKDAPKYYFYFYNGYTGGWISTGGSTGVHMYSR